MRDIAKELHLDEVKVQALEDNRFEELGAPVFAKGYLRKYAGLVNVPIDDVLADYYRLNRAVGAPPVVGPKRERPPADLFSGPWIAAVAVLLVAGAATWWWLDRPVEVNATPAAGVTAEGQADEPPVPRTEPAEDEPATAATPDAAMSAAAQSPPASEIVESESDPAGGPAADPSTTADTQAPPASAATGAAELQLELSYRGDCWTEVTDANGRRLYFGLGTDGRNISVSGVPPLRVLLGDNDNVSLMVDGRAYPVPASALRGNTARLMITGP